MRRLSLFCAGTAIVLGAAPASADAVCEWIEYIARRSSPPRRRRPMRREQASTPAPARRVHYRFSNEAGEEIGRKVAAMALAKVMRPLPQQRQPLMHAVPPHRSP